VHKKTLRCALAPFARSHGKSPTTWLSVVMKDFNDMGLNVFYKWKQERHANKIHTQFLRISLRFNKWWKPAFKRYFSFQNCINN